jgi:hypothetical protein
MKRISLFHVSVILTSIIWIITGCEKEEKNTPPVASFFINPEEGSIATIFTFDASGCTDAEDISSSLLVRWDWEGDGIFNTDFSSNKILNHQFTDLGTYTIIMEVKDSKEMYASLSRSIEIGYGSIPSVTTSSVSLITGNSAICGGEISSAGDTEIIEKGVCWSLSSGPTIDGYHTAEGPGDSSFTSSITNLSPNTSYYIRAYATNSAGTAYGEELNFNTLDIWVCGSPLTVFHEEGDIAPVSKTVTYGTTAGIPGEESKCWITRNLGADQQASAIDDVSEQSAGWYWQFNHKQGYKHDGVNRTPANEWNPGIMEYSNWESANDPCSLTLGDGWRITTESEWSNIIFEGSWQPGPDPWDSPLKLHLAGTLSYADGSIDRRGNIGYFWTSSHSSSDSGISFGFSYAFCQLWSNAKSHGFSLRCIKDQ